MQIEHVPIDAWSRSVTMLADALTLKPLTADQPGHAPQAEQKRKPRRGLLAAMDDWFWRQRMRAREAYLAQSRDIFELEARLREIERSVGSRYY